MLKVLYVVYIFCSTKFASTKKNLHREKGRITVFNIAAIIFICEVTLLIVPVRRPVKNESKIKH